MNSPIKINSRNKGFYPSPKKSVTKPLFYILLSFLFLFFAALPAHAANRVMSIDIDAVVEKDGYMRITQTWQGDFAEGTENYIPMNAPSYLSISELQVADENGKYELMPDWDIHGSFEDKANRCGINYTDNGYEICFGISEYGQNTYTISYLLSSAVSGYNDFDGVNFRFVNDEMNSTPTDVTVSIRLGDGTPITDEIADIWAFGFDGQVEFRDGAILAFTNSPITQDNHVTVMFSLNKGIISPLREVNDSFETVKNAAFEGSDYTYDDGEDVSFMSMAALFLGFIVLPIFILAMISYINKRKDEKKMAEFSESFGYFRDIPNGGNANATYELGRLFEVCEDGVALATGMLHLINLGVLTSVSDEEVGFMGRTKEVVSLKLLGDTQGVMSKQDEYLYEILESAAGQDRLLQPNELGNFADQHDTLLRNYLLKCEEDGKRYLNEKRCFNQWSSPAKFKYLTPNGQQELGELLGFKKYLEDFSLVAERGVKELPIWKELLSYAMLFGIADKVAQQMKELYPSISTEIVTYNQSLYTAYSYQTLLYHNMRNAEARREQAQRSQGSGGFSSLGGGGGSIGGGSGGGSR
ncbi:MAG: DUF2207 domain-containing protein [Oscillospiraceae bacterium]